MKIKEMRKRSGMTQEEVAQQIGVTQGAVWQWESGMVMPTAVNLQKLAAALNCTVDELLKDGEPQPEEMRPRLNEGTRSFEDNPPHHTLNR